MSAKEAKESEKKPIFKKWWFWVIIVVIIAAVGSGGSQGPKKVDDADGGSSNSQVSQEEKTEFAVGDVIEYDGRRITVNSVAHNYDTGNIFLKPETGKEFVKIEITIENKASDKMSYYTFDWKIQDSNGVISDVDAIQYSEEGALKSGELASGGKITASIFFEVPKDDAGLVLQYSSNIFSKNTINIKL